MATTGMVSLPDMARAVIVVSVLHQDWVIKETTFLGNTSRGDGVILITFEYDRGSETNCLVVTHASDKRRLDVYDYFHFQTGFMLTLDEQLEIATPTKRFSTVQQVSFEMFEVSGNHDGKPDN